MFAEWLIFVCSLLFIDDPEEDVERPAGGWSPRWVYDGAGTRYNMLLEMDGFVNSGPSQ